MRSEGYDVENGGQFRENKKRELKELELVGN